ncbi:MAG: DUF4384 domain-containing protein [Muribaculum sp.]|nr:DUF4384 domain-containing protein [Muribaculum sp.]
MKLHFKIWGAIIVLLTTSTLCYAQKPHKVYAEYTYYAPETMSVAEATRVALEQAKLQAIAKEFGTHVSQSNSSISSETNGISSEHFSSVSGSDVKGDWLETIGEPELKVSFDNRMVVVTCKVEGYAIEKRKTFVDYTIKILRHAPNLSYESSEFNSHDDMYVYFRSPIDGFLNIFLLDYEKDTAYCLLPYKKSKEGSYKVDSDKDYFFFSKDKRSEKDEKVDPIILLSDNANEMNDLMVVFSPKEFSKMSLNSDAKATSIPRNSTISKFNKWIAKLKRSDENIIVSNHNIIIHNND